MQSIASVIQALAPEEEIAPVEVIQSAIITPSPSLTFSSGYPHASNVETIRSSTILRLRKSLQEFVGRTLTISRQPEEAKAVAIQQLFILTGVSKGLTRTADSILGLDESPEEQEEVERMKRAREDPRVVRIREAIIDAIRRAIDLWSTDASVGSVGVSISLISSESSSCIILNRL